MLCVAVLLCTGLAAQSQQFESPHFTVDKLADGVYACIAKIDGYATCNGGIVNLGDATLVFDPFMTPQAAEDLKKAAEELTGNPVKYVVDSHFHNDHVGGNQVFPGATIISTNTTRELMKKYLPEEAEYYKKVVPDRISNLLSQDTTRMTPHELEEHTMWLGYFSALKASVDITKMQLPDVTFDEHLVVHGTERTVQLLSYGSGHTDSDLFMYLPDEQIVFLGDLLFIQNHPWMGDGDPEHWAVSLDSIARLEIRVCVPGHGPVGTLKDFEPMKQYLRQIKAVATAYHKKGILPENETEMKIPPPFDQWFLSNFYRPNVINEYERLFPQQR